MISEVSSNHMKEEQTREPPFQGLDQDRGLKQLQDQHNSVRDINSKRQQLITGSNQQQILHEDQRPCNRSGYQQQQNHSHKQREFDSSQQNKHSHVHLVKQHDQGHSMHLSQVKHPPVPHCDCKECVQLPTPCELQDSDYRSGHLSSQSHNLRKKELQQHQHSNVSHLQFDRQHNQGHTMHPSHVKVQPQHPVSHCDCKECVQLPNPHSQLPADYRTPSNNRSGHQSLQCPPDSYSHRPEYLSFSQQCSGHHKVLGDSSAHLSQNDDHRRCESQHHHHSMSALHYHLDGQHRHSAHVQHSIANCDCVECTSAPAYHQTPLEEYHIGLENCRSLPAQRHSPRCQQKLQQNHHLGRFNSLGHANHSPACAPPPVALCDCVECAPLSQSPIPHHTHKVL